MSRMFELTALAALPLLFAGALRADPTLPPLTELSGAPLSTSSVDLAWNTPFFDRTEADLAGAAFEFRFSATTIDDSNWDLATPIGGLIPSLAANVTVSLDLSVMANNQGAIIYWDEAYLRAWLTVSVNSAYLIPIGFGIPNETITFTVSNNDYSQSWTYTGTTDQYGMAAVTTADLYNGPYNTCSLFHFRADWAGHSISLGHGAVVAGNSKSDAQDMYLCEYTSAFPPLGTWSQRGGVYVYPNVGGAQLTFTLPGEALSNDAVVTVNASSNPTNLGLLPEVPGTLFVFEAVATAAPVLNKPLVIVAQYPASWLNQYGGVGESSIRGYWYDAAAIPPQWRLADAIPLQLNRDQHVVGFGVTQLGRFAIAAERDPDLDGLGFAEEVARYGTLPMVADTDDDGATDGTEVWSLRSDPLDPRKAGAASQWGRLDGLTPGQTYYIAGRARTDLEYSPVSNNITVTMPTPQFDRGDLNCDARIDNFDIDPFVLALVSPDDYAQQYPGCDRMLADVNVDGRVDNFDIDPFVALLVGG
ncbi:MAG: hypothetical protein AB7Q17_16820 [Phycisphaerae bacterium]